MGATYQPGVRGLHEEARSADDSRHEQGGLVFSSIDMHIKDSIFAHPAKHLVRFGHTANRHSRGHLAPFTVSAPRIRIGNWAYMHKSGLPSTAGICIGLAAQSRTTYSRQVLRPTCAFDMKDA
jgi:hypothetical protein